MFNKGTPHGEKGIIPKGGHCPPNSTLGANLAWKKAQKKDRKKNTSEIMNNTIPDWSPSITIFVWSPWKDPSRETSRHQINAVAISPKRLKSNESGNLQWNHLHRLVVKLILKHEINRGQGDSSVRWKGWRTFLLDIILDRIFRCEFI